MNKQNPKQLYSIIALLMMILISVNQPSWADSFEPSSTADQTRQQHKRLATNDIWWTVYGPDMLWNFKNSRPRRFIEAALKAT